MSNIRLKFPYFRYNYDIIIRVYYNNIIVVQRPPLCYYNINIYIYIVRILIIYNIIIFYYKLIMLNAATRYNYYNSGERTRCTRRTYIYSFTRGINRACFQTVHDGSERGKVHDRPFLE